MTILIIDDTPKKIEFVERAARKLEVSYIAFMALTPAIEYLKHNHVDGIITDMEFPLREEEPNSFESQARNFLLRWLVCKKKQIPVLGNSIQEFNVEINYPFYKGRMPGVFVWDTFQTFISTIKGHD